MGNILGGFKRFISNKNTVTILGVIAGVIVLWFFYNMRVNDAIAPTTVPYALEAISATEEIIQDNIGYVEINQRMLSTIPIMTNVNELVGKYITTGTSIPKSGFFYQTQVVEKSKLPNAVFDDIPEGYTLFSLPVNNNSTYGNSIYPGDRIDLYIKYTDDLGEINFGKFIEKIEVLAVRDSSQEDVFENTETGQSALLLFAVPDDPSDDDKNLFNLLTQASFISGLEIIPVPRNSNYTDSEGETTVTSQTIKTYIEIKTNTVSD